MKKSLLTLVVLLVTVSMSWAQVTTSALSGKVTDENGEVIGANVVAVHQPSGTVYGTMTNANGRYDIQGMRTGGPYKVTVSYIGAQTQVYEAITLQLGETFKLDVKLKESVDQLEEVVVLGKGSKFSGEKTGATTNISAIEMKALPTVNRSIEDIARISPYANGMSFSGGDGRSTNFTIDGANFNNNFGLSDGLPGGGNPISMDAIEEIQVVIAPFDVRQTNFIGGGINAITKSGTNTFKATAYTYQSNDNMRGSRVDNVSLDVPANNDKHVYGATFGGPIIKNKLFFFGAYEYQLIPSTITDWRASEDGVAVPSQNISRTTVADLQKVSDFVKKTYGYNTGSFTDFSADDTNVKILGRLDWNITNNHHLAVRYNYTDNEVWKSVNGNSSDTGYRLYDMNRFSQYSMSYANSCYSQGNTVHSFSFDLNSRINDKMSNQLLATYTNIEDIRGTDSSEFPFIDIMNGYTTAADGTIAQDLTPYISLGYELFTYNNKVKNKIFNVKDDFIYNVGNHRTMIGASFEHQSANNAYMRNGTGYYRFRSIDDFINGATPEAFALTYGYNGETAPNAKVSFNQWGFYAQDDWNITKNFKLNYGIRFDVLKYDEDDIVTNNAIYGVDYNGRHIDTGVWPDANVQFSPRVGFVWDVMGDKGLKVRGGTGLFAGRLPLVFFTNMPTNSGMIQNSYTANTKYENGVAVSIDPNLAKTMKDGKILTNTQDMIEVLGLPTEIRPETGQLPSSVCGIDKDFKMPQVWKSSIAVDYQVPVSFPLSLSAEYIYNETVHGVLIDNWNIKNEETGSWERFNTTIAEDGTAQYAGGDNRLIYPKNYKYNKQDAYVLTNTKKGYGYTANFSIKAEPIEGLNLMASYTHTESKELTGMPGNAAGSTWSGLYTVNGPNFLKLQRSQYVTPHRVIASLGWTNKSKKEGFDTHFNIFYQGYSPSGYSYCYINDMNGDGIKNDLMYIPKNDNEIKFKDEKDREAFWAYVEQDDYLRNHKGEYAEAYSARSPWVNQFDFRIAQDFGVKVGKQMHKLEISLDFMNVGNLLNSKWGVAKNLADSNNGRILKYEGKDENNTPIFSMYRNKAGEAPTESWSYIKNYDQCWKLQLGIRYTFN